MLTLIWSSSLLLSGLSVVILCVLALRRLRQEWRQLAEDRAVERFAMALAVAVERRDWLVLDSGHEEAIALEAAALLAPFQAAALQRAQRILEHASIVPVLERLATDGTRRTAARALRVAAALSVERRIAVLRAGLGHGHLQVRTIAAELLVECAGEPSIVALLHALLPDPDERPEHAISLVFRKLGRRGIPFFRRLLASPRRPRAQRLVAIQSLGDSGVASVAEILRPSLRVADPVERAYAWRALAVLKDAEVDLSVPAALHDPAWFVRMQAAFYCGELHLVRHTDALVEMLDAYVWWERYRAALALARMGASGTARLQAIGVETTNRSRVALAVLAEQGSPLT